jgi:hypothetical protein
MEKNKELKRAIFWDGKSRVFQEKVPDICTKIYVSQFILSQLVWLYKSTYVAVSKNH